MINKKIVLLFVLLVFVCSCGKQEASAIKTEPKYEYDPNSEQYSYEADTLKQYRSYVVNKVIETPKPTKIEKYSQLKVNQGLIIECKSTIEFVDGKTDNIIINRVTYLVTTI